MKTYTVPLKLLIAHCLGADFKVLNFQLARGKAIYKIDLTGDCIENNKIKAIHNDKTYLFRYDTNVQYIGRYMRMIWDFWNFGGADDFNKWILKKTNVDYTKCSRVSCAYHSIHNECLKGVQNNCKYKIITNN